MNTVSVREKEARRANFLAIITAGVLGVVFVLCVFGIYNYTKIISQTGKFLVNFSTEVTSLTCGQSMKAIRNIGDTVSTLGTTTIDFTIDVADTTMDAIIFTGELMQTFLTCMGDARRFAVKTFTGVKDAISEAMRYIVDIINEISPKILDFVKSCMERFMGFVDDIYELLEFLVRKAILPLLLGMRALPYKIKTSIEQFVKNSLPRIVRVFMNFGLFVSNNIDNLVELSLLTVLVTLGMELFKKTFGAVASGTIVTDITNAVVGVLGNISSALGDLFSFDFCSTILGFITPLFNLVAIPGVTQCAPQFIKVGIWWMTGGFFCKSETLIGDIVDCILGSKGDVTILPAFSITLNPAYIINLVGGAVIPSLGDPLDYFLNDVRNSINNVISSIPSLTVSWEAVTLRSIVGPLDQLITIIFTDIKNVIKATATRAIQASLIPTTGIPTPLPIVLGYIMFKTMFKIGTKIFDLISGAYVTVAQKVENWAGCIPIFTLCLDPCDWIELGFLDICDLDLACYETPSWCISNILPISISEMVTTVVNLLKEAIAQVASVTTIIESIVGSGVFQLPSSLNADIDILIDNAFNSLTNLYNAFNITVTG